MHLNFWWRGALLGLAIAAPVGPIGLLCIQRTLQNGRLRGLVSGLGAATADTIYGAIAAFGLTAISSFLVAQQRWLGLVGALFLCYLGVRTWRSAPATVAAQSGRSGWFGVYSSTFILTLTNPMTILAFVAIFAGMGLATGQQDYASAALLVVGVFCGSAAWWLLLSNGVALFRSWIDNTVLVWVNRLASLIIIGFGVWTLITLAM